MRSAFIGIQMGPRQFALPPNIAVSDSAGRYATRCSEPAAARTYGWSRCTRDSVRMPNGLRNSFSSSIRVRMRRSRSRVTSARMPRPRHPLPLRGLDDGRRAQRQQAHDRAHLDAARGAAVEAEGVIVETVLLVPHAGVASAV